MVANASSRILQGKHCLGLQTPSRACITGPSLLQELKATQQNGYPGWLELNANGDRQGRYSIQQLKPAQSEGGELSKVMVAEFDSLTKVMTYVNNISWIQNKAAEGHDHPESLCSHACKPHEARVVQEVFCCWTCVPCRANEHLTINGTRCTQCRDFFWPDPKQANTTCVPIAPTTPRLDTVTGVIQMTLALLCLVVTGVVFVFFHRYRQRRVIKASSRELSFLMLLGITIGYTTIIMLLAPPTEVTCRFSFFLFCVSFTLLYGPLLVRAVRIFRIFKASKSTTTRPRMVDSSHQLIFSFVLFFVQVTPLPPFGRSRYR